MLRIPRSNYITRYYNRINIFFFISFAFRKNILPHFDCNKPPFFTSVNELKMRIQKRIEFIAAVFVQLCTKMESEN